MASRGSKAWVADRAAWHRRRPWPVVTLNIDPGDAAGAAIMSPGAFGNIIVHEIGAVDTNSRGVERWVDRAIQIARALGLPLILVTESWGRGGLLGIDQWLGLGAARGAWRREVAIRAATDAGDVLTKTRSMTSVEMTTWRSFVIEETGVRDAAGNFTRFDPEGWKKAATRAFAALFPGVQLDNANAGEAGMIGAYAMRSDELGSLLPEGMLRKAGFEKPENPKTVKRRARKAAKAKSLEASKGPRPRRRVEVIGAA